MESSTKHLPMMSPVNSYTAHDPKFFMIVQQRWYTSYCLCHLEKSLKLNSTNLDLFNCLTIHPISINPLMRIGIIDTTFSIVSERVFYFFIYTWWIFVMTSSGKGTGMIHTINRNLF